MSLASTTVWEVRTTGSATNGGGFNPSPTYGPIATLSLTGAGTGYTAEDVINIISLNYGTVGTVTVDTVGGSGEILTWHLETAGVNYSVESCTVTGGTGNDDATFDVLTIASGTDYSQQDTAQESQSDLSCLGNDTLVTSALATFTLQMVGSIVYIADTGTLGNFVIGYYEIMTFIDANNVRLDRDPTNGTGDTLASFKVGGAVDHPYRIGADFIADQTAKIWVKKGTYTYISGNAVLDASYISVVEGYNATRGDNPTAEADMPQFDENSLASYGGIFSGGILTISNFVSYSGVHGFYVNQTLIASNCITYNNTTNGFYAGNTLIVVDCISHDNTYYGFDGETLLKANNSKAYNNSDSGFVGSSLAISNSEAYSNLNGFYGFSSLDAISCVSHHNTANGFRSNTLMAVSCIGFANTANGFYGGDSYRSYNCVAYDNDIGFYNENVSISVNCISSNNTTYGFSGVSVYYFDYNCYYGNGTDLSGITAGSHDVNADPLFVDPTANPPDFSLQSGSPCLNVGSPQSPMAGGIII